MTYKCRSISGHNNAKATDFFEWPRPRIARLVTNDKETNLSLGSVLFQFRNSSRKKRQIQVYLFTSLQWLQNFCLHIKTGKIAFWISFSFSRQNGEGLWWSLSETNNVLAGTRLKQLKEKIEKLHIKNDTSFARNNACRHNKIKNGTRKALWMSDEIERLHQTPIFMYSISTIEFCRVIPIKGHIFYIGWNVAIANLLTIISDAPMSVQPPFEKGHCL